MKYGISALEYSASFIEDDDDYEPSRFEKWLERKVGSKKLESIMMTFALALGIAMPIGLFILLPTVVAGFFTFAKSNILKNAFEGILRIIIFWDL